MNHLFFFFFFKWQQPAELTTFISKYFVELNFHWQEENFAEKK